jgi:hypothetical protein
MHERDVRWCWSGVSGWERIAPQGYPRGWLGKGDLGRRPGKGWNEPKGEKVKRQIVLFEISRPPVQKPVVTRRRVAAQRRQLRFF